MCCVNQPWSVRLNKYDGFSTIVGTQPKPDVHIYYFFMYFFFPQITVHVNEKLLRKRMLKLMEFLGYTERCIWRCSKLWAYLIITNKTNTYNTTNLTCILKILSFDDPQFCVVLGTTYIFCLSRYQPCLILKVLLVVSTATVIT